MLATDTSPAILEYAADEARRAGLANVATQELDGEDLPVDPGTFDAVISRLGLMYFPDKRRALEGAGSTPSSRKFWSEVAPCRLLSRVRSGPRMVDK